MAGTSRRIICPFSLPPKYCARWPDVWFLVFSARSLRHGYEKQSNKKQRQTPFVHPTLPTNLENSPLTTERFKTHGSCFEHHALKKYMLAEIMWNHDVINHSPETLRLTSGNLVTSKPAGSCSFVTTLAWRGSIFCGVQGLFLWGLLVGSPLGVCR